MKLPEKQGENARMNNEVGQKLHCGLVWFLQTLPLWSAGEESACQCREHGLRLWACRIPQGKEQLSPCATTTEPVLQGPRAATLKPVSSRACALRQRGDSEVGSITAQEQLLLAAARASLLPARAAKSKLKNKTEGLSSHSGDDSDVLPGPQGDTVGFTHWALPPFLWVTVSHPGKAWGPALAHKDEPEISKLGKLSALSWCGSGMSVWGHWQQAPLPPGREATPMEAETSDREYTDPEALWEDWATPPEASATLGLPRVWTQPSSLFSSVGEVLRSTQGPGAGLPTKRPPPFPPGLQSCERPHRLSSSSLSHVPWHPLLRLALPPKTPMTIPGSKILPAATRTWSTPTSSVGTHWPLCQRLLPTFAFSVSSGRLFHFWVVDGVWKNLLFLTKS